MQRIVTYIILDPRGANQRVDIPFDTLVCGNFTGRKQSLTRGALIKEERLINRSNFSAVMQDQEIKPSFEVENCLGGSRKILVELPIVDLSSFHPDTLDEHVEVLRALKAFHELLNEVLSGVGDAEDAEDLLREFIHSKLDGTLMDLGQFASLPAALEEAWKPSPQTASENGKSKDGEESSEYRNDKETHPKTDGDGDGKEPAKNQQP